MLPTFSFLTCERVGCINADIIVPSRPIRCAAGNSAPFFATDSIISRHRNRHDVVVAAAAAAASLLPLKEKDNDVISSTIRADFFSFIIALVLWTAKEADNEDEDEDVDEDDDIALRVGFAACSACARIH